MGNRLICPYLNSTINTFIYIDFVIHIGKFGLCPPVPPALPSVPGKERKVEGGVVGWGTNVLSQPILLGHFL